MKSKKRLAHCLNESTCDDIFESPRGKGPGSGNLSSNNEERPYLPGNCIDPSLIGIQTITVVSTTPIESISNDLSSDDLSSNDEVRPYLPSGYLNPSLIGVQTLTLVDTNPPESMRMSDEMIAWLDALIAEKEAENQKNAITVNAESNDPGSGDLSPNNEALPSGIHNFCVDPTLIEQITTVEFILIDAGVDLDFMRIVGPRYSEPIRIGQMITVEVITVNADPNDLGFDHLSLNNEEMPSWLRNCCIHLRLSDQTITLVSTNPSNSFRLSEVLSWLGDYYRAAEEAEKQKNAIMINADPDSLLIVGPSWYNLPRGCVDSSLIGIQTIELVDTNPPEFFTPMSGEMIAWLEEGIAAEEAEKQKNAALTNADPDSSLILGPWPEPVSEDSTNAWNWSQAYLGTLSSDWKVAAIGDFQGDGVDDIIIWQQSTGNMYAWENGNSSNQRWVGNLSATNWEVAAVGDYNGDGKEDLLLRELITGWGGLGYWGGANASNWTDLDARVEDRFAIIA